MPPKSLDSNQIRYSTGTPLCATHLFTFSHVQVIFEVSRLYGQALGCLSDHFLVFQDRSQHLFQAGLSLLDAM